jgi:glycerate 2-kinase
MKVVIAPDSFKESFSASEVADALAEGVVDACPSAIVDLCPMADGGEGTVDAMVAATDGQFLTADVFDPLGAPIRARFGLLGTPPSTGLPGEVGLSAVRVQSQGQGTPAQGAGGLTAVIEMAAASGLALVHPDRRDPLRTTTFGTGQLILSALEAGARRILLGIGGSATVDGGAGCAQALGVTFVARDGEPCVCGLAGGGLIDIAGIDLFDRHELLETAQIHVACDVTNPLLGPNGAATVYGPQKGATPETVEMLEEGLAHLAELIRDQLGVEVADLPGAGAAGGLGAGLVAFAGATLEPGLPMVAEAVGLKRRLADADLCLTGEGCFDAQSSSGKTAFGVARIAKSCGVPTICIPGDATSDAPREVFSAVHPLVSEGISKRQAMASPGELLKRRAGEAMRRFGA